MLDVNANYHITIKELNCKEVNCIDVSSPQKPMMKIIKHEICQLVEKVEYFPLSTISRFRLTVHGSFGIIVLFAVVLSEARKWAKICSGGGKIALGWGAKYIYVHCSYIHCHKN